MSADDAAALTPGPVERHYLRCPHCGGHQDLDARFCLRCGAKPLHVLWDAPRALMVPLSRLWGEAVWTAPDLHWRTVNSASVDGARALLETLDRARDPLTPA